MSQVNFCFRDVILPAVLVTISFGNILGTYLTVSLKSDIFQSLGHGLFPTFATASFNSIIAIGTICGYANRCSRKCVLGFSTKSMPMNRMSRIIFRKMVRSCSLVKIRFGSNFMEISTPLVMSSWCAKSSVRLLLLYKC